MRAAPWRIAAAVLAGLAATLAFASVAAAHVEVEAEPAVAGATDAVVTFTAEAESPSAGIASVRIVLPSGLAPADVTLDKAPRGWRFARTGDGYTVRGTPLRQGVEAVHSVRVARLPDADELVFKAIVTYSDGTLDRWIEAPTAANPSPDNEAPVLALSPAPTTSAAAVPTPTPAQPTTPEPVAAPPSDPASSSWIWWVVAALLPLAAVGLVLARRRRAADTRETPPTDAPI